MFTNLRMDQVFIGCGPTDLRKSVDGLAAIVQESFQLDPFSSHLFVFCNRKKDKLKILHWDHNGFWLFYRRLEEGLFDWPDEATTPLKISGRQFKWLLEGLPMNQKSSHVKVSAKVVI